METMLLILSAAPSTTSSVKTHIKKKKNRDLESLSKKGEIGINIYIPVKRL